MDAIGSRTGFGIATERRIGFVLDLSGADFSWTYLEKADLSNANLTFANLFRAVFYDRLRSFPPPRSSFYLRQPEANPSKGRRLPDGYTEANDWRLTYSANLSGADLSYANLSRAGMGHVNRSGTQIRQAILCGARLMDANLREASLNESDRSPCDMLHTNLAGADLTDARLSGSNCSGTDMTGAILHGTGFAGAKLWAAMLNSATLTNKGQHPPVGLIQEQLDQTIIVAGNYPDLEGIADTRIGETLVWRDAIPRDEKLRRMGRVERLVQEAEDEEDGGEDVNERPTFSPN